MGYANRQLGSGGIVRRGSSQVNGTNWLRFGDAAGDDEPLPFYGISQVLTVPGLSVADPSIVDIVNLGLIGLIGRTRRTRAQSGEAGTTLPTSVTTRDPAHRAHL